jgi:hypothetical protein
MQHTIGVLVKAGKVKPQKPLQSKRGKFGMQQSMVQPVGTRFHGQWQVRLKAKAVYNLTKLWLTAQLRWANVAYILRPHVAGRPPCRWHWVIAHTACHTAADRQVQATAADWYKHCCANMYYYNAQAVVLPLHCCQLLLLLHSCLNSVHTAPAACSGVLSSGLIVFTKH